MVAVEPPPARHRLPVPPPLPVPASMREAGLRAPVVSFVHEPAPVPAPVVEIKPAPAPVVEIKSTPVPAPKPTPAAEPKPIAARMIEPKPAVEPARTPHPATEPLPRVPVATPRPTPTPAPELRPVAVVRPARAPAVETKPSRVAMLERPAPQQIASVVLEEAPPEPDEDLDRPRLATRVAGLPRVLLDTVAWGGFAAVVALIVIALSDVGMGRAALWATGLSGIVVLAVAVMAVTGTHLDELSHASKTSEGSD